MIRTARKKTENVPHNRHVPSRAPSSHPFGGENFVRMVVVWYIRYHRTYMIKRIAYFFHKKKHIFVPFPDDWHRFAIGFSGMGHVHLFLPAHSSAIVVCHYIVATMGKQPKTILHMSSCAKIACVARFRVHVYIYSCVSLRVWLRPNERQPASVDEFR